MDKFNFGKCKLVEVNETDDDASRFVFETDEVFRESYAKLYGLSEFEQEHFNKTLLEVIEFILKRAEDQRVQSSEFLWSVPKDNDE